MATRNRILSHGGNHNSNYAAFKSQPDLIAVGVIDETTFGSTAKRTTSLPSAISSNPAKYAINRATPRSKTTLNWKGLPARVLDFVLEQLRDVHLAPGSSSCTTCYARDLTSVQLTCKAWFSDAQRHLYTNIEIVGDDDPLILQKWKLSRAARLARLRSTLRSRQLLAALVKTIHVPDPHIPLYLPDDYPNPEYDGYLCTLASVVMSCPNLEALTGFIPFYNHTFDRLTHALSTRAKLRQHVWVIAENDDVSARSQKQLPPGLLDEHQIYQFTHYHDLWVNLETLMLCSPGSLGVIEHDLLIHVLHSLPSLQHLCISSFDADDFHDKTLLSFPPVKRLRIEECSGITENGLTRWAASPSAVHIDELALLYQSITALSTLSKLLASLNRMTKFTILQNDFEPSLTEEEERVALQPTLASSTLAFLHWDILCREDQSSGQPSRTNTKFSKPLRDSRLSANAHLALSVQHDGFPRLRYLRAPRDTAPYGILQSICLPAIENSFLLPDDKNRVSDFHARPYSNSLTIARIRAQRMAQQAVKKQALNQTAHFARSPPHSANDSMDTLPSINLHAETNVTATTETRDQTNSVTRYKHVEEHGLEHDSRKENDVPRSPKIGIYQTERGSPRLPPRHPLHFKASPPNTLQRISRKLDQASSNPFRRPTFCLAPDVAGCDENGGLVGWAELLGVREKARIESDASTGKTSIRSEDVHSESGSESELPTSLGLCRGLHCDGSWNRSSLTEPVAENQSRLVKVLTSSSKFSVSSKSTSSLQSRSKSKSSSRLTLPLDLRPSARTTYPERWKHIARPKGERGQAINIQDFF